MEKFSATEVVLLLNKVGNKVFSCRRLKLFLPSVLTGGKDINLIFPDRTT